MEWTIARDRWRSHLQTRGQYYLQAAPPLDGLHARAPQVGADVVAMALRALGVILEQARVDRLTRNQHILFRIGEWIALAETAASLAHYAADQASTPEAQAVSGYDGETVKAMSRVYAREVALRIASEGLRWLVGAQASQSSSALQQALYVAEIYQAQAGLLADSDTVADALRGA
jgi:hypothetical protein